MHTVVCMLNVFNVQAKGPVLAKHAHYCTISVVKNKT